MRRLHALGLAALAAGALFSPVVGAQSKKEPSASELSLAKDMLKDAIAEEKNGKCQDALSMLKQVAAIKETGEVFLHMGDCQTKLGDKAEALKSYERAEDLARADKDKATQQALVQRLGDLREKIPTVAIKLPDDARDAKVKIDGEVVEDLRLEKPIPLTVGEHTVEVSREGHRTFSKKVTLAEKDHEEVQVELPRETTETPATPIEEQPTPPDKKPGPTIPLPTWIAGGAAVVLAAGGVIAFVSAGSKASDGQEACKTKPTCDQDTIDSVHTLDALALGMWIGAGISAGVAVTFFVLARDSPQQHAPPPSGARARPSARVAVGPGSVRLIGTF